VNDAVCNWLGYTREELLTMYAYDISATFPGQSWVESWELVKRHGSLTFETRAYCKDGRILPVEATVNYLEFNDNEYLCAFVRDITERKQMEQMLRETNDELRLRVEELEQRNRDMSLLTEMSEGLQGCQTIDDAYRIFARVVTQLFEHQAGALYLINVGSDTPPGEVVAWGPAHERVQMCDLSRCLAFQEGRAQLSPVVKTECPYSAEHQQIPYMCIPLIGHDDVLGILQITLNQPATEHELERQKRLATTVADHFALALTNLRLHEQLREQAIRDALTGLFNRRYLEDTLMRELRRAARHQQPVGVILIDIDHFKQYNTTYGLAGGDATLRAVGQFLQQSIRSEDIACRYGGEEFTLILPGSSRSQTRYRAEELRRAIKHVRAQHEGRSLGSITISLGVASYPDDGTTANEVLGAADHALGIAKQQGRDQVVLAVPVEVSPEQ
jgi:diguanylate cyclase (GGDEF)-like protein/PAS domain S-box-containing protein